LRRDAEDAGLGTAAWLLLALFAVLGAWALVQRRLGAGRNPFAPAGAGQGAAAGPRASPDGLLARWLRPQGPPAAAAIEPVATLPLGMQPCLRVVAWHGEELLLACSPQGISVLARHVRTPPAREAP
jgi:hypothetical protein